MASKNSIAPLDENNILNVLLRRSKEEESPYARMLFLENDISLRIVVTLLSLGVAINHGVTSLELTDKRAFELRSPFKVKFSAASLSKKTLGDLIQLLLPYISREEDLTRLLKELVKLRNRITHNMYKYKYVSELDSASRRVVAVGDKVTDALVRFAGKLMSYLKPPPARSNEIV